MPAKNNNNIIVGQVDNIGRCLHQHQNLPTENDGQCRENTADENRQNGGITDIFAHAVIVARTEPLGNRQTETVADSP